MQKAFLRNTRSPHFAVSESMRCTEPLLAGAALSAELLLGPAAVTRNVLVK